MVTGPSDASDVIYEHPLNERVRTLLRLEFLFGQGRFGVDGESPWHSRIAVESLVDIVALLSRGDLRSEIQKELERMVGTLEQLQERPGVDLGRLEPVLVECRTVMERLRNSPPGIPAQIRDNEFLSSISQRAGILGGSCGFDIPSYHRWLHQDAAHRRSDLERWFAGFHYLNEATHLILKLMRNSATPAPEEATNGTFQANLDRDTPYQMLRVRLPAESDWFPEISGSRHFCTIRFMRQPDPCERPQQTDEAVRFALECCSI